MRTHGPTKGTDDACGDRVLKAEGVPDRDDELAHGELARTTERHRNQAMTTSNNSQVGIGIVAHQLCLKALSGRSRRDDLARTVYDMTIGKDKSVGGEGESRTGCAATPLPDLDVDNGGTDVLDRAYNGLRVCVEKGEVRILPEIGACRNGIGDC